VVVLVGLPSLPGRLRLRDGYLVIEVEGAWTRTARVGHVRLHPGNIKDDESGDVANDPDHRYHEDVAMMH
jgi:hypothetical protein